MVRGRGRVVGSGVVEGRGRDEESSVVAIPSPSRVFSFKGERVGSCDDFSSSIAVIVSLPSSDCVEDDCVGGV